MTERNTRIRSNQIRSILPNDVESTNSRVDTYVPSYNQAEEKFTWVAPGGSADQVSIDVLGTPTYDNVQDAIKISNSAGLIDDITLSEGSGLTVEYTAITGFIRNTDDHAGELFSFDIAAGVTDAIPTDTIRYIYVEYNGGTPKVSLKNTDTWNWHTEFPIGSVVNEGDVLYILTNPVISANHPTHTQERFYECNPFKRADRLGGIILGESGTRNITLTSGEIYDRDNEFDISAKDTGASAPDDFDSYSSAGQESSGNTQWDNDNYDNAGTLTSLSANKFAVLWFYIELTSKTTSNLVCVYGTAQWNTSSGAETESAPTVLPNRLIHGTLVSRLIFQKGASTATEIQSAFDTVFAAAIATDHNNLATLQGGTTSEYYHLTTAEHTELTNWLDNVVLSTDGSLNLGTGSLTINSIEIVGGDGEVNKAAVEDSGNWDAAYTHVSNDGSDHSFIDQSVVSGSSPTLDAANITGILAAAIEDKFLRNDGADSSSGRVTAVGLTSSDSIIINADDKKLVIGTGSDAEIYVNSDNLIIKNVTQDKDIIFNINDGSVDTEVMRIVGATSVISIPKGQLKFPASQNASADANTLDDYEEGTWTMGVSFGGGTTGITYSTNTGYYTKKGREVTVTGYMLLTNKGSSSGTALMTGLPFTVNNNNGAVSTAALHLANISFANQHESYAIINTTSLQLQEITEGGAVSVLTNANFANDSHIIINATYVAA